MSSPHSWPVKQYISRHTTWPYTEADFARQDHSSDSNFYSAPRFVTHIDDLAITSLREYYDAVLPKKQGVILDVCSSWISHFPEDVQEEATKKEGAGEGGLKVIGMGMNQAELDANAILTSGRILQDLNDNPDVAKALKDANIIITTFSHKSEATATSEEVLDATTLVVSIDYLTQPVQVLKSLLSVTKPNGTIHLTISNRCFPTKAIRRWLQVDEEERSQMVGDFLFFAGWRNIEIVELSDGTIGAGRAGGEQVSGGDGGFKGLMNYLGMAGGRRDPLWVVRAVKEGR